MKKSITDILWEEIKENFYVVRCYGVPIEKVHDMWSRYQCELINKIGEDDVKQ